MSSQRRPAGRQRPIRMMLALVFVIPLVSLLALWGFAASVTLSNAIQEHNFNGEDNLYGGAAENLAISLALEREYSFVWLSSGRHTQEAQMLTQFGQTGKAVSAFLAGVRANSGAIIPSARPALTSFEKQLDRLPGIHAAIESGRMSAFAAFQAYNTIANSQFDLYSRLVYVGNVSLYQQAEASVAAGRALELADRELALISGSFVNGGQLTKPELQSFAQDVAIRRFLMTEALKQLNPSLGSGYRSVTESAAYKSFEGIENSVVDSIGRKGPVPVSLSAFLPLAQNLFNSGFRHAETQDRTALSNLGTQIGNRLLLELALAGGLGFVAVAASVFLMARFARRVGGELTGLQAAALELATAKLPGVVERLGQGEDVDVAAEAAPLRSGRIAEIAKVTEAFGAVQRMAVESAVGQARLRKGVSQVFRNLAWRSQSLLHRQLSLLDAMERKTTDPDDLEELFRLDHLTTRMRRHAEGLIILSGAEPGRAWRDPVPILDVLRAAVAEIEDYKRVTVLTDSEDAVVGSVVADLIHLMAELVENATFYSPASTEVTVKAGRVANGFAVEIEDRGIGISELELARINQRLAYPPEFDPVNSDQLGLFVVARLAARHNVRITLRQSPYGGTTAIVLLPHAIVVARGRVFTELDKASPGWLQATAERAAIPPAPDRVGGGASADDAGSEATDEPAHVTSTAGADPGMTSPVVGTARGEAIPAVSGSGLPQRRPRGIGPDSSGGAAASIGAPSVVGPSAGQSFVVGPSAGQPSVVGPSAGGPTTDPLFTGSPADPSGLSGPAGLPRRIRQASLAPQLRADVVSQPGEPAEPDPAERRSAERNRALVEALQFGWRRGRADADDGGAAGDRDQAIAPTDRTESGGSSVWTGREDV